MLEIAAAGGHNLLFAGPPGIGKTMLARRLPGILPPLEPEAALEVTRIHSIAGLLPSGGGLITTPPFRAPHHTASTAAIVGGGASPRPGEATLAHHGVLLMDELPEFPRPVLEALRQPLEDGTISVARVGGRAVFPARFQLVGTMNLCPCGARGDPAVECTLLAAPDRPLPRPALACAHGSLRPRGRSAAASRIRARGAAGRALCSRAGAASSPHAALLAREPVHASSGAQDLLARAVDRLPLSGRGRARVARVARSIAALAGAESINPEHVAEALSYRSPTELSEREPRRSHRSDGRAP